MKVPDRMFLFIKIKKQENSSVIIESVSLSYLTQLHPCNQRPFSDDVRTQERQ